MKKDEKVEGVKCKMPDWIGSLKSLRCSSIRGRPGILSSIPKLLPTTGRRRGQASVAARHRATHPTLDDNLQLLSASDLATTTTVDSTPTCSAAGMPKTTRPAACCCSYSSPTQPAAIFLNLKCCCNDLNRLSFNNRCCYSPPPS